MLFKLLSAMAQKRWTAATSTTPPPPHTETPLADVTQRSMIEISTVPLILAGAAKSLLKPIPGRNIVTAIGGLSFLGHKFYRVYLSQGEGAFLHLVVATDPKKILECRLYQPYHEIVPEKNGKDEKDWAFWLLDNPDPKFGGMIGCPIMQGKNEDGGIQYQRSWVPSNPQRIQPYIVAEVVLDIEGHYSTFQHTMMHYERQLNDTLKEFLLVSAVENLGEASVNMWLGMDIETTDLSIYPAGR